jgi:hypothetical protein
MKRIFLALFISVLLVVLAGCDEATSFSVTDIEGTWNFPDQSGYTEITAYVLPDATGADIGWKVGTYSYWCWGDGTYANGVISGTYDYNLEDSSPEDNDDSGLDLPITITFTLNNGKLSISCSGSGPLNGKTFTQGVFQPI